MDADRLAEIKEWAKQSPFPGTRGARLTVLVLVAKVEQLQAALTELVAANEGPLEEQSPGRFARAMDVARSALEVTADGR